MKICYLVLAFDFKRLIDAIKTPNSRVFVHINKKADLQQFQTFDINDIVFIKKRAKLVIISLTTLFFTRWQKLYLL